MADTSQQQSRLKELIARGKEQGYLTYAEVNDHLPEDIASPDQVEDIIQMINDIGIKVFEQAPDADQLILSDDSSTDDEDASEEAAAALAAVENDTGRTTDPVRMYMREMGTVELLTREGEIVIDKPGKGAFYATGLGEVLAELGTKSLVFAGVTTEVCVQTTMREANDRGFECLLIEEATESYFPAFKAATLDMIRAQGGIVGWTAPLKALGSAINT